MPPPDPAWPSERLMRAIETAPMPANVAALLDVCAMRHPQREFLNFFDDADTITYGEMARLVRRAASALERCGVRAGSHVAVMVHTCRHYPVTWLALASLGAVTVPVNHRYTARELAYVLEDSEASHLVVADDLVEVLESIEGGPPLARENVIVAGARRRGYANHWESLVERGDPAHIPGDPVSPDSLMNIQYTSGTTGMPKGARQTHRYWLTFSRVGAAQFQDRLRRLLVSQPFYYVDAQWYTLMCCWMGATAFVARQMHSSRLLEWLRRYRLEYCNLPELVARSPESPDDHMDHLVVLSCYSFRPALYAEVERRFGALARQGFSMTEIGCGLYVPMEAHAMTGSGTVGIPAAHREAMVADPRGVPVPHGHTGELCVRGAALFEGYHAREEATREVFHPGGWFRTGDLARRDDAGWYWYLGRIKDMVRRSSENISAVEVEQVLRAVPQVSEAAVVPVPDELRGEEVKAYLKVGPREAADPGLVDAVLRHCRANLAPFKVPRYLELVEEFPRTPSNKIRKSELLAAKSDLRDGAYDVVEQRWRRGG